MAIPGLVRASSVVTPSIELSAAPGELALGGSLANPKSMSFTGPPEVKKILARLDVAVNDTFFVRGVEGRQATWTPMARENVHREMASGDTILERFAFEQFHHEEEFSFRVSSIS